MATITPKTIPHYIEHSVIDMEKSIELINLAVQQGKLPSRAGHIWTFTKTVLCEPISLALRVAEFATFAIALVASIPFGSKGSTRYYALDVIVYLPLNIVCKVVCGVIRISAAVLGVGSPEHAVKVWLWADRLELSTMQKRSKLLTDSFPAKTTTEFSIEQITPGNATCYLGGNVCREIEHGQLGAATLSQLDEEIKVALAERIVVLQSKFPDEIADVVSECEPRLFPNFAQFSVPANADTATLKDKMAPLQTRDLNFLSRVVSQKIAFKIAEASFAHLKSNDAKDKENYEQLKKELNVREEDLKIALSYRANFGSVKILK